jgi:hypothetical protein
MSNARKQSSGFRVTERDVEVVRWLGRVRLATVRQIREKMGMGRTKAYERLAGLVGLGLVVHERGVPGHGVYLASREGLRMAGLGLAPASMSLGSLAHDLAVAEVVARLESQMPGIGLLTERELRAHVHETGDQTFRPRVSQRGMRESRHWPDLVLLTGRTEPSWLAIEVELQKKGAQRLQAILAGYDRAGYSDAERKLWGVLYVVPDADHQRRLLTVAARVDLTADSWPVQLGTHRLDQPDEIVAAIVAMWKTKNAIDARRRQSAAQREQQQRQELARQTAERAAREAAAEQQREAQLLATQQAAAAAEQRSGIGRLFGGSSR